MFFILSKILGFIADPLVVIVCFFVLGLFSKRKYRRRKHILISFLLLLFFSNGYIHKLSSDLWNLKEVELQEEYDYGILLGGIISLNSTKKDMKFGYSSNRLLNTIKLYKTNKINKIIISGASGSLQSELIEADYLKKYLVEIGIPNYDIICEKKFKLLNRLRNDT